ncbi:FAD-binding oxidoreductase [Corynebacterium lubricantis]|uniref:FAD-binding oxidoreductase n=1 Tax=Corynebacterium lubricantis TaxID=541095 RepID=UPI000366D026|nr:FAD-binding oxidoreductase [Corynebacterium lubricantis]
MPQATNPTNARNLDTTQLLNAGITVRTQGQAEYDEARHLWNGMIDRHPALIIQPKNTEEVAEAVKWARANNQPIAVKGGGHSAPGHSMCDDGVVIDLVNMQEVTVDPEKKEAWGQGGALLGDLDKATAPHSLVVPAGAISHTGMGGLVLGGGFGHIMRKFGLSIDSLLSCEIVLADGTIKTVDKDNDPDLFWALRGGSGNFGIVTQFHFKCHDFHPDVYLAALVFDLDDAREVAELWREEMAQAPEDFAWLTFFRGCPDPSLPGFEWIPEDLRGKPILLTPMIWAGDHEEGRAYIEALRNRIPEPVAATDGVLPYVVVQQQFDDVFEHGPRHYAKAGFLEEFPDEAIDDVIEATRNIPHVRCQIEILTLGGAVARVDNDATAFNHRHAKHPVNILGLWDDKEDDEKNIAWVRDIYSKLEPHMSGGAYINYFGGDEEGGTAAAYGGTWDRLVELKERYDPENVFRFNANIKRK